MSTSGAFEARVHGSTLAPWDLSTVAVPFKCPCTMVQLAIIYLAAMSTHQQGRRKQYEIGGAEGLAHC